MKKYIILLFVILSSLAMAQKPPCDEDYYGLCYFIDGAKNSPPLSISMPYEVMKSYIFLDSLVRHQSFSEFNVQLDNFGLNRDVLNILKNIYIAKSFDQVRYFKFDSFKDSNRVNDPFHYFSQCRYYFKNNNIPVLYDAVLLSDYILRVRVNDVIVRYSPSHKFDLYLCTSVITDTIMGGVSASCKDLEVPDSSDDFIIQEPLTQLTTPGSCFQFSISEPQYDGLDIQPGREYIIFPMLYTICPGTSKENLYFYNFNRPDYKYKSLAIEVKDGIVYNDPDFGLPTNMEYGKFKQELLRVRDSLFNSGITGVVDNQIKNAQTFNVIPNVTDNFEDIKIISAIETQDATLRLYNSIGQLVLKAEGLNFFQGENKLNLQAPNLNKGMYYLSIKTKTSATIHKIIIL